MIRIKFIALILAAILVVACMVTTSPADQEPSVRVHFEQGKAALDAAGKDDLRRLFDTFTVGPRGRVFVVGYTDAQGPRAENYKLSRQRADAVRREIVDAMGIDAGSIIFLGKGPENPLADNKTAKGRALNRRAEIYLVNEQLKRDHKILGPDDPYWPDIHKLVMAAEESIKARRLEEAFRKLNKAHGLGADRYPDWHAVSGIAGYYASAPPAKIRAHLISALNMDPYNRKAREYLSRIQARQKVARGEITRQMGRSAEAAIDISHPAQQYEYLRLFDVEPLNHRQLETQPVDVWQCVDRQGAPVVYYFNHARAFQWAFAGSSAETAPVAGKAPEHNKIWDSRIFK